MKLLIALIPILLSAVATAAMPWENIVPLRTTRAEVLVKLGTPLKNDSDDESFKRGDALIKIRYLRDDCFDSALAPSRSDMSAVVRRVTVIPNTPLKSASEDALIDRELSLYATNAGTDPAKARSKALFTSFLKYNVDCLMASESFSCSESSGEFGFGKITQSEGIISLDYFPTTNEWNEWKSRLNPC